MAIPKILVENGWTECCGLWLKPGDRCRAVLCPIEKERQAAIAKKRASEMDRK